MLLLSSLQTFKTSVVLNFFSLLSSFQLMTPNLLARCFCSMSVNYPMTTEKLEFKHCLSCELVPRSVPTYWRPFTNWESNASIAQSQKFLVLFICNLNEKNAVKYTFFSTLWYPKHYLVAGDYAQYDQVELHVGKYNNERKRLKLYSYISDSRPENRHLSLRGDLRFFYSHKSFFCRVSVKECLSYKS